MSRNYESAQNAPASPCLSKIAAASAALARSQRRSRRVAYHSAPSSYTVCGATTAPGFRPLALSHSSSSPSDRKAVMFAHV